jgi:hypothetical protein
MFIRTPRFRATILAGREHTLKDQAGRLLC